MRSLKLFLPLALIGPMFAVCLAGPFAADDRLRPYGMSDTDRDVAYFFAAFRAAESDRERSRAVVNLCLLHDFIRGDSRYARSDKLRGMQSRVVYQLRAAERTLRPDRRSSESRLRASRRSTRSMTPSAAEQPQAASGDESRLTDSAPIVSTTDFDPLLQPAMALHLATFLQWTGGSNQLAAYAGHLGPDANAEELIRLIQATISPQHWDVNGGPGHLHWYSPACALVVLAGSEAQDGVGGLLQGLRDNGQ